MNEKEQMLTALLKCRRVDLVAEPRELTDAQKSEFGRMVERRAKGEPLQYIIGHCDFMGTQLTVDKSVLIPRPETEILVELAIEKLRSPQLNTTLSVLDIGTGSGNIAITLARLISNSSITALDFRKDSLQLAIKNAENNKVDQKIVFLYEDMTVYLKRAIGWGIKFDMIVSNPPYIRTSDLDRLPADVMQEPLSALDGGEDGLYFYRSIIPYAFKVIRPEGCLMLEIGDEQSEAIEAMFKKYPRYTDVSFHKDYVGTKRIVTAQIN